MKEKREREIKVKVTYTDGYRQRFTKACLDTLRKRELMNKTSA